MGDIIKTYAVISNFLHSSTKQVEINADCVEEQTDFPGFSKKGMKGNL